MRKILAYSKAIAALLGSVVTAVLAVVPPDEFRWLAIVGVVCTAVATWAVPNIVDTPAAPATPAA